MDWREIEQNINRLPDADAAPSAELLRSIEQQLTADLRPVKPLRPAWQFAAIWTAIFAVLVLAGSMALRPLALPILGGAATPLLVSLLGCAAALMSSMARQMTPGSRYAYPPSPLPAAVLAGLAIVFFAIYPMQPAANFWHPAMKCFSLASAFGLLAGALFWISLRRGAYTNPRLAGATAGLLAGLTGTTFLTIHCPVVEAAHVMASHLAPAAVLALVGLALANWASHRASL